MEPKVTIVIPCLNESGSLSHCIKNAKNALDQIKASYGIEGEIVVADNGSTDGSQELAACLGARLVPVAERGYGAAIIGGCTAAIGSFLLIGDADGSYDFVDGVAMIGALLSGIDLCMGSRFKGGIKPGAMPWKNRYIGNPVLTGILNLLFRAGVDDAHCGLRALSKPCFERLKLSGAGMEFASEMVIKAALLGERITEVPVTLYPDLRNRAPHLRPWRDGWRHLRYLLMFSPAGIFAIPAASSAAISIVVLAISAWTWLFSSDWQGYFFGNYWVILAGSLLEISHVAAILAVASHLYGVREGYRRLGNWTAKMAPWISLETMLIGGLMAMLVGGGILIALASYWSAHKFARIGNVLPVVIGASFVGIGIQSILGGFLLAIIGGNEAQFLRAPVSLSTTHTQRQHQTAVASALLPDR